VLLSETLFTFITSRPKSVLFTYPTGRAVREAVEVCRLVERGGLVDLISKVDFGEWWEFEERHFVDVDGLAEFGGALAGGVAEEEEGAAEVDVLGSLWYWCGLGRLRLLLGRGGRGRGLGRG
jgi:hypothetical protein